MFCILALKEIKLVAAGKLFQTFAILCCKNSFWELYHNVRALIYKGVLVTLLSRETKKLLLTSNKPNSTLYVVIRSARRRHSSRLFKSSSDDLSEYDSVSKPGICFVNCLWTDSSLSIKPICVGDQMLDAYSSIAFLSCPLSLSRILTETIMCWTTFHFLMIFYSADCWQREI